MLEKYDSIVHFGEKKKTSFMNCFQNIHQHLAKTHVKNRLNRLTDEKELDWATAEALAFGKLTFLSYGAIHK